jgi:hypothetical protein
VVRPMPRRWRSRDDDHDHWAVGTLNTPDRPRWIRRGSARRLTPAAAGAAPAAAPKRGAVEPRVGARSE